jgi:hypothetical protein
MAAWALAASRKLMEARGDAPCLTAECSRVSSMTSMTYSLIGGATWTPATVSLQAAISEGVVTGWMAVAPRFGSSSNRSRSCRSSSRAGRSTTSFCWNRSRWASGSANTPSISMGFCVAMTRNGDGSCFVSPSMVTWVSCIDSRRALWVFGVARFISSATTTLENTGPSLSLKVPVFSRYTLVPVMSAGSRSGVIWTRAYSRPVARANRLAAVVFAMPGTPSSST